MSLLPSSRLRVPPRSPTRIVEGPRLDDIAAPVTLLEAWLRVRANKGGPGRDGVTIEAFALTLDARIARLSAQVLAGRYRPQQLRRAPIPKASGGQRWLSIPTVGDRVVQTAALVALMPTLEPRMSEVSWAYRPGRGVADAIAEVMAAYGEGYIWTVDADITRYFDRVPHDRLIDELTIWIDDERIIRLFGRWLHGFGWRGRGIAQGSPVSPLLANLYLHPIDRLIVAAGFKIVRYADDLVILTRTENDARLALALLRDLLRARGLSLNRTKTAIRDPEAAFEFLGQNLKAHCHAP